MARTIKDIAELAGVSYGTVSRVINERPGVNAETRAAILSIIREQGFQPNAIARSLVTRQSKTIALIVPDISQPLFGSIALSVDKEAFRLGYNTVLCNTGYDLRAEQKKMQFISEKRVDGVIIKPAEENSNQFEEFDIPTVLISHVYDGDISYIDIENRTGGYLAGEHLAKCGYRRIAFIGGYEHADSTRQRLDGFRHALKDYGLVHIPELTHYSAYNIKSGYQIIEKLLADGADLDAAFCGNDLIALGVIQKAAERGMAIPQQLGVVGFDDGLMASLPQIQLTTVAQPACEMGEIATKLLLDAIRRGKKYQTEQVMVRPHLVKRATTVQQGGPSA